MTFNTRSCNILNQYLILYDAISEPVEQASTMIILKPLFPVANILMFRSNKLLPTDMVHMIRRTFEFLANNNWLSCHPLNLQTLIRPRKKWSHNDKKYFTMLNDKIFCQFFVELMQVRRYGWLTPKENEQIFFY